MSAEEKIEGEKHFPFFLFLMEKVKWVLNNIRLKDIFKLIQKKQGLRNLN